MKTKMNNKVKALLMACCAVLLVFASVIGTLAYLTDTTEKVTNTFTVGKVDISLDEACAEGSQTNDKNGYKLHLVPGVPVEKTPVVTVLEGSEACYVRIMMTINNARAVKGILGDQDISTLFMTGTDEGFNDADWTVMDAVQEGDTLTVELRYNNKVATNGTLNAPFTDFVIPATATNTQIENLNNENTPFEIALVAHAIQADGFEENSTLDTIWSKFSAN